MHDPIIQMHDPKFNIHGYGTPEGDTPILKVVGNCRTIDSLLIFSNPIGSFFWSKLDLIASLFL